ncbi:aspartate aminotransferase family protein [Roseospirillum parvum]|uniref:4-aminobutyrate---pyruvate transaminase n=1 Tax=Roseospirillum parvum TaxID=83401 RepID=A0A1G8CR70_9PROT|nr:aspartate aminotransferase family protein [Roseospirillum parvum]SDH47932.1 4-aminobutyrate---pyruvate transaminase [Roseospirillum parvum]
MTFQPNSPHARDVRYHLHPYTNLKAHEEQGPLIIERGEGVYVFDDSGKRYLEGLAGLWCTGLGFSEERLAKAAYEQMRKLPYAHSFAHRSHPAVIDLAEKLISLAPDSISKVFFTNSGSEANDTQVKIVRYYNNVRGRPEKKKIIARKGSYHGITLASASLTGLAYAHKFFDLPLDGFLHTEAPHPYHGAEPGESEEDYASRLAQMLDDMIVAEGPDTVAAFIAEPVMGAGGVMPPPATYFEKIQAVLKKHDVLFIADEVICGFGRTGNMFACETYGLKPDMLTVAKQLSSGYLPIAGAMVSDEIYQVLKEGSAEAGTFGTGYTYTGHPVSAAVALETLNIYQERDIVGHVRAVMGRFQERLMALGEHPLVGEARGVGLIGAVELVEDKAGKRNFDAARKIGARAAQLCQEEGVLLRPLANDTVAACPPLIIEPAQVEELFDGFTRGLDRLAGELGVAV